jgi:hypothetical protein
LDARRVLELIRPFFESRKEPYALDDLADLQFLLGLPGLDLEEVRGYFEGAGLVEYFERLRRP